MWAARLSLCLVKFCCVAQLLLHASVPCAAEQPKEVWGSKLNTLATGYFSYMIGSVFSLQGKQVWQALPIKEQHSPSDQR